MSTEQDVASNYAHLALEQRILDVLRAAGRDIDRLAPDDLAPVEDLHTGGRQSTAALVGQLALRPDEAVIDIGCGIGGTARYLAGQFGVRVTGIDLTPEFVTAAASLTRRVGLADRIAFRQGSALALPVETGAFDAAVLIHVGMNIPDKPRLCAEAARVLKPGGRFALFDLMAAGGAAPPAFPVPWAARPSQSFLATPGAYRQALEAAGFTIERERDRRAFAIDFFRQQRARAAAEGAPPLSTQVILADDMPLRIGHLVEALEDGRLSPVEMIARR